MENNIINLGNFVENSKMISPEMCLHDCLKNDIGKDGSGAFEKGKKLIIIGFDDTNPNEYSFNFRQAGMRTSEIISLLEIAKNYFIKSMGF